MLFFQLPSVKVGCAVPPTHLLILAHAPTNGIQKLAHWPLCIPPQKKRRSLVAVMLKMNLKYTLPENFPVTGGCFECNTYCIMVLEEEEEEEEEEEKER